LVKALAAAYGNISEAAAAVGMQRSNFSTMLKKHGLSPARSEPAGDANKTR